MRILLHSCCGQCSIHSALELKEEHEIAMAFCECNLDSQEEYDKRLADVQKVADMHGAMLFYSGYDPNRWKDHIKGLEEEPEGGVRCAKCYEFRLREAANIAKQNGYEAFATTLTVSPHKNAQTINLIGNRIARELDIIYMESDFKKNDGFKISADKAKKSKLYRQDYCGCEFSVMNKHASPKE
jgi:predicted adenine nucleotide alpha hydrolase (AANH) superfamily ATPase